MNCASEELERLLSDGAFIGNFGFMLNQIAGDQRSIAVPFQEAFQRPGGIASGQVYMAIADVAMQRAIKTKLGLQRASVTAKMKTDFLDGPKLDGFRCTAKVPKFGRRLIYRGAECTDKWHGTKGI
jgi:acyl-coenzyme A thioesterase PaaI-like protein